MNPLNVGLMPAAASCRTMMVHHHSRRSSAPRRRREHRSLSCVRGPDVLVGENDEETAVIG